MLKEGELRVPQATRERLAEIAEVENVEEAVLALVELFDEYTEYISKVPVKFSKITGKPLKFKVKKVKDANWNGWKVVLAEGFEKDKVQLHPIVAEFLKRVIMGKGKVLLFPANDSLFAVQPYKAKVRVPMAQQVVSGPAAGVVLTEEKEIEAGIEVLKASMLLIDRDFISVYEKPEAPPAVQPGPMMIPAEVK